MYIWTHRRIPSLHPSPSFSTRLCYRGQSFWVRCNRIGKAARRILLLNYILPTQLRDKLPAFRIALHKFVWALRRLDGQVYCYDKAVECRILPGSRVLRPEDVASANPDLIQGLVLMEGCLPIGHLKPSMHHFVHYGEYTATHGSLRWVWMMYFERYNYQMKSLVCDHATFVYVCCVHVCACVPTLSGTEQERSHCEFGEHSGHRRYIVLLRARRHGQYTARTPVFLAPYMSSPRYVTTTMPPLTH